MERLWTKSVIDETFQTTLNSARDGAGIIDFFSTGIVIFPSFNQLFTHAE